MVFIIKKSLEKGNKDKYIRECRVNNPGSFPSLYNMATPQKDSEKYERDQESDNEAQHTRNETWLHKARKQTAQINNIHNYYLPPLTQKNEADLNMEKVSFTNNFKIYTVTKKEDHNDINYP
ncbi:hypothetical protein COBT_003109, partial [Conglomerata obtusa]